MKSKIFFVLTIILVVSACGLGFFYHGIKPFGQKGLTLHLKSELPFVVFASSTATETSAQPEEKSALTMQFFGDIMLDRNAAKAMGKQGLEYIFAKVKEPEHSFFLGVDFMMANLEGPFAPKRVATSKTIAFRFDPSFATQLKSYGFDAFNLANNHSYDMGKANVEFTRQTLAKAGLGYFGDELNEGTQYTYISSSVAFIGLHNTYHNLDLKKVQQAIDDAHAKAKFIVVNIHWGEEYKRASNQKQQQLAHWLVDHGVDAIIGHHPHVVEEMEVYKGKPIFYSLGNFIFDQYFSKETQEGLSVEFIFGDAGVKQVRVLPFVSDKSQVQPMTSARLDEFMKWFEAGSRIQGKFENGYLSL